MHTQQFPLVSFTFTKRSWFGPKLASSNHMLLYTNLHELNDILSVKESYSCENEPERFGKTHRDELTK